MKQISVLYSILPVIFIVLYYSSFWPYRLSDIETFLPGALGWYSLLNYLWSRQFGAQNLQICQAWTLPPILGMKLGSLWNVVNYTDANKYILIYRKFAAMTLIKFVTQVHALICWNFFFLALRPNAGHGLLILEVSRSHTSRITVGRTPLDAWSARRRDLPDNIQHSQQTDIHAPGGIRTHNLSRRSAVDLGLRPLGHWDRHMLDISWEKHLRTEREITIAHRYVTCDFWKN